MEIIDMQKGLEQHSNFLLDYQSGANHFAPQGGIEANHHTIRGSSFNSHNVVATGRLPMSSDDREVGLARFSLSSRVAAGYFENGIQLASLPGSRAGFACPLSNQGSLFPKQGSATLH